MSLPPFRVAINQATTRQQWGLIAAIQGYARGGVHGIAVWPDKLAECGADEASRQLRLHEMTVTGYCCGNLFDVRDSASRKASLALARRRVDEAAAIGANCLVAVVGGSGNSGRIGDVRRNMVESLAELLPYARNSGVPIAIEPIHPMRAADICCINTLAQANEICGQLGDGAGVVVDTYHVWWDPLLEQSLAAAHGKILAFHLADWLLPTTDLAAGRGMIGDGVIDFPTICRWVTSAGYTGFHEVEVMSAETWWRRPPDEVVATCVERLQRLATSLSSRV